MDHCLSPSIITNHRLTPLLLLITIYHHLLSIVVNCYLSLPTIIEHCSPQLTIVNLCPPSSFVIDYCPSPYTIVIYGPLSPITTDYRLLSLIVINNY